LRAQALKKINAHSDDPRLEDQWKVTSLKSALSNPTADGIAILSYADDEGIRLNHGRPGAKDGPSRILFYLGRLVHQRGRTPKIFVIKDKLKSSSLAKRHEEAEKRVQALLKKGYRVVTLGGGHDYGYPDAAAYAEVIRGSILNIDAHLDLRPVVSKKLNSGTPFFRFVERFGGYNLIEWGIQDQCNASAHKDYAKTHGVRIYNEDSPCPTISGLVGISVCLDAFQGIRGVSAPAMVGLSAKEGLKAVAALSPRSHWVGIYECAPKYDPINEDSARLGALFAYRFIHPV
jgi:formiminoglutamase